MTHVDLVKNEWLAGYQLVVGRVTEEGGGLRVDTSDKNIRAIVESVLAAHPAAGAAASLADLHQHISGDYVFATEPHDTSDCAFREMVVPLVADHDQHHVHAV